MSRRIKLQLFMAVLMSVELLSALFWDPKAAKANAKDFVNLTFVQELKKSGFINKLYGHGHLSRN